MKNKALAVATPIAPGPVEVHTPSTSATALSALAVASSSGITPKNSAALDAAVSASLGKKVHVVSVKLVDDSPQPSRSWVDHGLGLIHGSHNTVQRGH
jgi:hypothetical protein